MLTLASGSVAFLIALSAQAQQKPPAQLWLDHRPVRSERAEGFNQLVSQLSPAVVNITVNYGDGDEPLRDITGEPGSGRTVWLSAYCTSTGSSGFSRWSLKPGSAYTFW